QPTQISTRRLLLRDFVEEDWADVHAFRSDPLVAWATEFAPENQEETREWLRFIARYDQRDPRLTYNLAIVLRLNGAVIGWIGIGLPSRRTSNLREYDFGYCLNREFWGRGYMTEAAQAILAFGFGYLRAQRIFAECHVTNSASARVMEKAGMRLEGR